MNKRYIALFAAFTATTLYAINHTVAKDAMPTYIKPFGFILLRVISAVILFWLASIWAPKQKIDKKDWPRILLCSIFGMVINMLFYFKGLQLSTPIDSSVLMTFSPILIFIMSAIFIGEKVTVVRTLGILLGFVGAISLVLFDDEVRTDAPNIPLGNVFFTVNAASYAIYLVMVKPLTAKYHVIHLMKWFFLFGLIVNFPICISEFKQIQWNELPTKIIWEILYVIIGTTFFNIFT